MYVCMCMCLYCMVISECCCDQVRGVSKHLVVDIGVTIQGEEEDELPEVIICQNRFQNVDLDAGELIP